MVDKDLMEKGRAMRRELLGPEATDRLDAAVYDEDPIMTKFGDLTQEVIFGILWQRPGLDLKTRSLVTMVSDVSTGQLDALGLHLRFCLRFGYTEDELVEIILHLMGYVGVPAARKALIVASKTFADVRAEGQSA
jgi:alkylhydroperoxidase/carboxymuconolactone decarboxylase family protein YurZ